ncbi:hypothetical protein BDQ12DRAFT_728502 [Crucibulum laeve]|uniref:CxC2-like cysteine cluster KDZ transposase-associated domain-containing protein n=1 Tax=Crucibulum laeve TaxID=68775 RepID=A0A5C3LL70_9AGAR|nr:hypothetical protein BDQ12DRAFT_728502 [Crucibulum laeve]
MTTPLDAFDGAFSLSDPVIETDQSAKTQTSETLRLFKEMLLMIVSEILSHEADPLLNTPYNQFPHRQPGNLSVVCPSYPEPHVNMEHGWQKTPPQFHHFNQKQEMLDGNHHNGKYAKNSDPGDISLFEGKSLMPLNSAYKEYLRNVPKAHWQEKSTCSHLNALNKQDQKKFKNMDITGIVNLQCSHVFIKASVDLQFGERFFIHQLKLNRLKHAHFRFANVDYALTLALQQHCHLDSLDNKFITSCNHLVSYDIACAYWVHVMERFEIKFPDLVPAVKKIHWLIPAVHMFNHKDNCIYIHAAAYTPLAGHFHSEMAEHYWAECNQLGPQT